MRIYKKGWSNGFDGPGRRWVYYLKGCNFNCLWCGNPEGISRKEEVLYYPERDFHARQACDKDAITDDTLNRKLCNGCQHKPCVRTWKNKAFELAGETVTESVIMKEIMQRSTLFGSTGGVTFSGGEPTLQLPELIDIATKLKALNIHTAIETNASSKHFDSLFGLIDLLICDLKCITEALHKNMTGISNKTVIKNIVKATKNNMNMVIRVPLIKEMNFTAKEKKKFFNFFTTQNPQKVEFIRLHHLGHPKYRALNKNYLAKDLSPPSELEVKTFCKQLQNIGINATLIN